MKKLVLMSIGLITITAFNRPARHATARLFDRTTLDSVFTAEQAQRGDSIFRNTCDKCHGAAAEGKDNDGGRLVGKSFLSSWDGVTLDQLHLTISTTMPSDNPKTLASKDVSDVIAYLLSQNQFPAGSSRLSDIADSLKTIKIQTTR